MVALFFFFKQKTAYEMRISDWSSDVCSSDLPRVHPRRDAETISGASDNDHDRRERDSKDRRCGEELRRPPHDVEPGAAPREQRREPGLEKGERDAESDRDGKAAERTADQRLEPAREQPARPVEEKGRAHVCTPGNNAPA